MKLLVQNMCLKTWLNCIYSIVLAVEQVNYIHTIQSGQLVEKKKKKKNGKKETIPKKYLIHQ